MKVEDWSTVTSNGYIAGVLARRAHPSELGQESLWQNDPKWLTPDRSIWPVAEDVRLVTVLERHAKAIVVKKTRMNTDEVDLVYKLREFGLQHIFG